MQGRSPQPFGKRNRIVVPARTAEGLPAHAGFETDPHRAFFAAARAENDEAAPSRKVEVPRSLRAAVLAGIVVACGLAGLDATAKIAALHGLAEAMPDRPEVRLVVPALRTSMA